MTHNVVNCVSGAQSNSDAVPKCVAHRATGVVAQACDGIDGAPQSVETVTSVFGSKIIVKVTGVIVGGVDIGVAGRALRFRPYRGGRNGGGILRIKCAAVASIGNLAEVQRHLTGTRINPDAFTHRVAACLDEPCQDRPPRFTLNEPEI